MLLKSTLPIAHSLRKAYVPLAVSNSLLKSFKTASRLPMANNAEKQNRTSVCASAQSSWDPALSTASPLGQPKLLLINTARPEPSIPERSSLAFSPQSVQYIYLGKSQQVLQKQRSEVLFYPLDSLLTALTPSHGIKLLPEGCPGSARPRLSSWSHQGCPLQCGLFLYLSNISSCQ